MAVGCPVRRRTRAQRVRAAGAHPGPKSRALQASIFAALWKSRIPQVALLPPPQPPRRLLIAAARRRGLSTEVIGNALGISWQAVCSQIAYYEKFFGAIEVTVRKRVFLSKGRKPFKCKACGSVVWPSAAELDGGRYNSYYCSRECRQRTETIITRDAVVQCINMRRNGSTWLGIGKIYGVSYQTVQKAIWLYLYKNGMLNHAVVLSIWRPAASVFQYKCNWDWLEGATGISMQKNGQGA